MVAAGAWAATDMVKEKRKTNRNNALVVKLMDDFMRHIFSGVMGYEQVFGRDISC